MENLRKELKAELRRRKHSLVLNDEDCDTFMDSVVDRILESKDEYYTADFTYYKKYQRGNVYQKITHRLEESDLIIVKEDEIIIRFDLTEECKNRIRVDFKSKFEDAQLSSYFYRIYKVTVQPFTMNEFIGDVN